MSDLHRKDGANIVHPTVSVIMPAHNAAAFIAEAMGSVLEQTFGDLELIVIDDCSTDNTADIIKNFADRDSRVVAVRNKNNHGAAGTRNLGLEIAGGEWIALLDSDDKWRPEKLERQLKKAEDTGADLIYSSYSLFENASAGGRDYVVPETTDYDRMLRENVIGCSTVLIRRSAVNDRRFPTDVYHEDYALWLELLRTGCKTAGCSEVLVDWRIVETSRSFNKRSAAKNRWMIFRKVEKLPLGKAASAFVSYLYNGLKKHRRF